MTTRTITVTPMPAAPGPDGAAVTPGRVRPGYGPAPGTSTRPGGRRDACRPGGRPGPLVVPSVRPWPSCERVRPTAGPGDVDPRGVVVRRRRAIASAVLAVVLLALVVVVLRVGGAAPAPAPAGAVPAGSAIVVVAPGESLLDLARRSAPTADADAVVSRIRTDNHLSGSVIPAGRPLVVPAGG